MLIREATEQDWPQLYAIITAVLDEGTTYAYPARPSDDEARTLWYAPGHVVVAVDPADDGRDTVLGTASMGPNRPGRGAHVATAGFMVGEHARGRGVGRALGEHMLAWAAGEGFRAVQFNAVVETNTAAVALWRALGFSVVGTVPEAFDHPAHGLVGLHVMHTFLPSGSAGTAVATGV